MRHEYKKMCLLITDVSYKNSFLCPKQINYFRQQFEIQNETWCRENFLRTCRASSYLFIFQGQEILICPQIVRVHFFTCALFSPNFTTDGTIQKINIIVFPVSVCRTGGLLVRALDSRSNGLGSSPGRDTALYFWARHFFRHVVNAGVKSCYELASYSMARRNTLSRFMLQKPG